MYLLLFQHLALKNMMPFNRIRYLIGQKSDIPYVFSHNYARSKNDLYDSLPSEKKNYFSFIIDIKSVLKKSKKHCYCNIFLVLIIYLKITKINKFLYKLQMLYYDSIDNF